MPAPEPYGITRLKGFLDGNDNWGTVLDELPPEKNLKGIEVKKYLVVPSPHMMKQYPELQKRGALEYNNVATWREYPTYWIVDENPSRTNAIARIDCGFDGRETPYTRRVKKLTEQINLLRRDLDNMTISNIVLVEEKKKLLHEKNALMKDLNELYNIIKKPGVEAYGQQPPEEQKT